MTALPTALPTVAGLCRTLGQHLQPAPGFTAPETTITAVHVSELVDPTAYVAGGELLLTTGLVLPTSTIGCEKYVARLRDARIAALGIGLGPAHAEPPAQLVEACRQLGVTLLVVPAATPFLTVTHAYWAARSRSTEQDLQDAVAAHRALVDAAVSADPPAEVLRRLARIVDGWAASLSSSGTVDQIFPTGLVDEAASLQSEVKRLEVAGVHSAASFAANDRYVAVFPLAVEDAVVGYLAVGTRQQLSASHRRVVLTAVTLLSIDAVRRRRSDSAAETAGSCVATLVDLGEVEAARRLAAAVGLVPPGREGRVLLVRGARADEVAQRVRDWCPDARAVRTEHDPWFLLPPDHPRLAALHDDLAEADPSASAVVSDLVRLEDVGATRSRLLARVRGLRPGQLLLTDAVPGGSHRVAAALDGFLDHQGPAVVDALVAYLRHRGQWEQASRDLGVHRNTLRYRVARAREALALDVDDPDTAARLWLLLRDRGLA